jgi:hypothetical protein
MNTVHFNALDLAILSSIFFSPVKKRTAILKITPQLICRNVIGFSFARYKLNIALSTGSR